MQPAETAGRSHTTGDYWLFQLEGIASGETCYFHDSGELADDVEDKLGSCATSFSPGGK